MINPIFDPLKFIYLSLFLICSSCAYSVHHSHMSDFEPYLPIERGEIIHAESEQFVVMGFVSDTNYVDEAYQELQTQCPNKSISPVTTLYSTDLGFFSWKNRIKLMGVCRR